MASQQKSKEAQDHLKLVKMTKSDTSSSSSRSTITDSTNSNSLSLVKSRKRKRRHSGKYKKVSKRKEFGSLITKEIKRVKSDVKSLFRRLEMKIEDVVNAESDESNETESSDSSISETSNNSVSEEDRKMKVEIYRRRQKLAELQKQLEDQDDSSETEDETESEKECKLDSGIAMQPSENMESDHDSNNYIIAFDTTELQRSHPDFSETKIDSHKSSKLESSVESLVSYYEENIIAFDESDYDSDYVPTISPVDDLSPVEFKGYKSVTANARARHSAKPFNSFNELKNFLLHKIYNPEVPQSLVAKLSDKSRRKIAGHLKLYKPAWNLSEV